MKSKHWNNPPGRQRRTVTVERQKLTPRQARFIEEYLVDMNATQAAIRAGYKGTPGSVTRVGCDTLRKTYVQAALAKAMQRRSDKTQLKSENVIQEIARLAFSNIGDYVSWDEKGGVRFTPSKKLSADAVRCVSEISETRFKGERTIKFKLHDKVSALDKLAKHLGLYQKDDGSRAEAAGAIALEVFRRMLEEARTKVSVPREIADGKTVDLETFREHVNGKEA